MEDHLGSDLRCGWRGYPICFWGIGNGNYLSVCLFSVLFLISLNLVPSAPFPHLRATRLNPLSPPPPLHARVEEKSPGKKIKFLSLFFFFSSNQNMFIKSTFHWTCWGKSRHLGGRGGDYEMHISTLQRFLLEKLKFALFKLNLIGSLIMLSQRTPGSSCSNDG